jgi:hypothetical protein
VTRTTLNVIRGDSHTLNLDLSNLPEGGLAGADVWFTVGGLFDKRLGSGIDIVDAAAGTATISIDPDDTAAAPDNHQVYPYDVQVLLADGTIQTPITGLFVVVPDVTIGAS